ncbi:MAG: DoxX family protein [Thermomicrobiales bacterium]
MHYSETANHDRYPVSWAALARGLAVLRIFVGIIFFANGLAKLTGERNFAWGWYRGFLIVRSEAQSILNFEVNERNGGTGTQVPFLKDLVNDHLLPNWDIYQWVVTWTELGVGLLLIVGFLTRGASLLGLGFQLFLAAVYFSSGRWMFEQPHEYVPLVILAIVPAGFAWGIDGMIQRRLPGWRRWPL